MHSIINRTKSTDTRRQSLASPFGKHRKEDHDGADFNVWCTILALEAEFIGEESAWRVRRMTACCFTAVRVEMQKFQLWRPVRIYNTMEYIKWLIIAWANLCLSINDKLGSRKPTGLVCGICKCLKFVADPTSASVFSHLSHSYEKWASKQLWQYW